MSLGFWQILLVVVLLLLFFGRGKIPQLMGDIAEGIKSFKKGISDSESDKPNAASVKPIEQESASRVDEVSVRPHAL
jgi:sec-independent protein translocase protein TatA